MDAGATEARGYGRTTPTRGDGLLGLPLLPPGIHTRPWWFPVQELRNPVLFYLEAWLADLLFGPDRAIVPKMEWMSLAPLTVDTVNARNLVEITVFGWPDVQHLVKVAFFSYPAEKMVQLEEFLKVHASRPQTPPASCCISIIRSMRIILLLLLKLKGSKYP
uniref:KH-like RNA-binding domain-containing protein n=1 Tax=Monodon monoceros TaxID=40151 RepID=A0A8C6B0W4_MONMO